MSNTHTQATYHDHKVIDEQGRSVGKVTDVIYSTDAADVSMSDTSPAWLVVDPGVLRAEHYVPAEGTYYTADDDIVVPWTLDWIKSAPKVNKDHVVTDDVLAELRQHYGSTV